jgi:hypothetical protein
MSGQRIAIWGGPRDISTLLLYSFHNRGDCTIIDEPLHGYYLGFTGQERVYRNAIIENMDINPTRIIETLQTSHVPSPYLCIKNIAHQIIGLQWDFLLQMKNIIVIQQPDSMIQSYSRHIPAIDMLDLSYEVQYQMILYLAEQGIEPIVILDTDLTQRPTDTLEKLCEALKIPFNMKMLSWKPGKKPFEGLWSEHWYQTIHQAESFNDYQYAKVTLPQEFHFLEVKARPLYEKLMRYSL